MSLAKDYLSYNGKKATFCRERKVGMRRINVYVLQYQQLQVTSNTCHSHGGRPSKPKQPAPSIVNTSIEEEIQELSEEATNTETTLTEPMLFSSNRIDENHDLMEIDCEISEERIKVSKPSPRQESTESLQAEIYQLKEEFLSTLRSKEKESEDLQAQVSILSRQLLSQQRSPQPLVGNSSS